MGYQIKTVKMSKCNGKVYTDVHREMAAWVYV